MKSIIIKEVISIIRSVFLVLYGWVEKLCFITDFTSSDGVVFGVIPRMIVKSASVAGIPFFEKFYKHKVNR